MAYNDESLKIMGAIYKFAYENPNTHKNTMRKVLLTKGKIPAKNKFQTAFEGLVALGKLTLNGENVSINPSVLDIGLLQKNGEKYFVVTPKSKKHFEISKSVASGYKTGDLLDVVIEPTQQKAFVMGKSKKEKSSAETKPKETKKKTVTIDNENLVLGRVVKISHDELVFIPNKKSIPSRQIPILNNKDEYSSFQDKLCIMNLTDINAPLLGGHIIDVKGDAGNPIHEYDAIAESYGGIMSWTGENIENEIAKIPTTVSIDSTKLISEEDASWNQKGNVVDLRHLPFVTVDPATCKDMDDAIYSTFDGNGDVVCYTAVANVTKYVDLNSEIGERYMNAGFTIYAPNKAYNILPTKLSTGICSLNPNEDRLAFVVKTVIDKSNGSVKSSNIYDAVINSKQKYSYEQAQEVVNFLDGDGSKEYLQYKAAIGEDFSLEEQLLMNYYAGQTIKVGFDQRKMIRFVSNKEREIIFDDGLQDVVDIKTLPHLQYHEIIEAFMITANESTAKYAKDNNLDNIFRVHDQPNPRKVDRADEFFSLLGIEFDGDLSAQGTRTLIELIKDTSSEEAVNKFLIKMQSRAVYSDHLYSEKTNSSDWLGDKISHYALQSPHYSHTTSPIRRVPDYITQYNILANMHGTKPLPAYKIQKVVEIANQRQLEVDQAEKDFEDISSVIYCEKHIGELMHGRVSKLRFASPEEGYTDDIVVIVKNEEKGISVEIPLSQILGRTTEDCGLSEQHCAVYNGRGDIVLTLCKPIDFYIDKADRKTMIVVGKTNKELVKSAEIKSQNANKFRAYHQPSTSYVNRNQKNNRVQRIKNNQKHSPSFTAEVLEKDF